MVNGNMLEGVSFGFRDERWYPAGGFKRFIECIHWTLNHRHKARLMAYRDGAVGETYTLSIHEALNEALYREDPREATKLKTPIIKWSFHEFDPLAVVSILEEWSKKEPLKYVEAEEAAMLSLPS